MIFYLDNSIKLSASDSNHPDHIHCIHALENLTISHRYGHHIVIGDYDILEYLSQNTPLSDSAKAIYRHIHRELPTLHSLLSLVKNSLCIYYDEYSEHSANKFHSFLSILNFSTGILSSPTVILAENLQDVPFFIMFGELYMSRNKIRSIKISAEADLGGGDTTATKLNQYTKNKNKFCVCVVDSDRDYPDGPIGETAKKVKRIENSIFTKYLILKWRELENYIPLHLLESAYVADINKVVSLAVLRNLYDENCKIITRYLDLKTGLKLKSIRRKINNNEFRKFYYSLINSTSFKALFDNISCDNIQCQECKPICKQLVFPSLGISILDDVNKIISGDSKVLFTTDDEELNAEVDELGSVIFEWCCSLEKCYTL